jgi:hypothetical protein
MACKVFKEGARENKEMIPKNCGLTNKEKLYVILHTECNYYFEADMPVSACAKCPFNDSFYFKIERLANEGVTFDAEIRFYLKGRKK